VERLRALIHDIEQELDEDHDTRTLEALAYVRDRLTLASALALTSAKDTTPAAPLVLRVLPQLDRDTT
jgi:hypothetical protein